MFNCWTKPNCPSILTILTFVQVSRLVAAHLHTNIDDNDLVITADVDAFIMTPFILQPLGQFEDKTAWIWQYEHTATTQDTFAMSFIGFMFWSKLLKGNGE